VGLARTPVDASDPLLFHKTTRRDVYEAARRERPDCDDVILWNSAGELTETSIANLVLELDGRLLTPALDCGLLPGTLRQRLLAEGRISEARLNRDDLRRATRVWLINSVRGWREAELVN
jgi:para-aminobenzoate synthetase/4-amino-4-deoxychorismate lyase